MEPHAEAIIAPSHSHFVIEELSEKDLAIQEEVPRSEPDAAVKGSTEGLEIHDEALEAAETKSLIICFALHDTNCKPSGLNILIA